MNGFLEERLKKLNVNRGFNIWILLVFGVLFVYMGLQGIFSSVSMLAEDGIAVLAIGLVISLALIALGAFFIRMFIRRKKQRTEAEENPYLFVKPFGIPGEIEQAAREFNEEFSQGPLFESFEKMMGRGFWVTGNYVLADVGLRLELGYLPSVAWGYAHKEVTIINKRRYECINFYLFFPTEEKSQNYIVLSCNERVSQDAKAALKSCGLSFSQDKKLFNLAQKDWQAFQQEHLTGV